MVLYTLQDASCEWVVDSWLVCGFVCGNTLPNARQKIQMKQRVAFFWIRDLLEKLQHLSSWTMRGLLSYYSNTGAYRTLFALFAIWQDCVRNVY